MCPNLAQISLWGYCKPGMSSSSKSLFHLAVALLLAEATALPAGAVPIHAAALLSVDEQKSNLDDWYEIFGYPNGSPCTDHNDCTSGRCFENVCVAVAQGNLANGSPCAYYEECMSGRCWENVCVDKGTTGAGCGDNADCSSNLCSYYDSTSGDKCCPIDNWDYCGVYACCDDMPEGSACMQDSQCHYGSCVNWICDAPKKADGDACQFYDDCESGRCWDNVCVAKGTEGVGCGVHEDCASGLCSYLDGTDSTKCCPSGTWNKCGLYGCCHELPDGSACYEHAQCQSGSCDKGACATVEKPTDCGPDRHMCSSSDDTSTCWDRVEGGCVERNGHNTQDYQWFEDGFRCGHDNQYYLNYAGRWGGAPKIAWGSDVTFPEAIVEDGTEWDYACSECLTSLFARCLACANNTEVDLDRQSNLPSFPPPSLAQCMALTRDCGARHWQHLICSRDLTRTGIFLEGLGTRPGTKACAAGENLKTVADQDFATIAGFAVPAIVSSASLGALHGSSLPAHLARRLANHIHRSYLRWQAPLLVFQRSLKS